jgi:tetratricopeptide (TPR) repeat protein
MDDYAAARPLLERALATRETVLGERHPDTAQSLNNLGLLFQHLEDLNTAREHYGRALEINLAVFGEMHPYTAFTMSNLATTLNAKGERDEAWSLQKRALAAREATLGDHPDTAATLINLAGMLKGEGKLGEARVLLERAVSISETAYGRDHPETALAYNNLAAFCGTKGISWRRASFSSKLRESWRNHLATTTRIQPRSREISMFCCEVVSGRDQISDARTMAVLESATHFQS